jgi:hypothetical protein
VSPGDIRFPVVCAVFSPERLGRLRGRRRYPGRYIRGSPTTFLSPFTRHYCESLTKGLESRQWRKTSKDKSLPRPSLLSTKPEPSHNFPPSNPAQANKPRLPILNIHRFHPRSLHNVPTQHLRHHRQLDGLLRQRLHHHRRRHIPRFLPTRHSPHPLYAEAFLFTHHLQQRVAV